MERLFIRYTGRVQGVGFRVTVADLAADFEVVGRVCNVDDRSVQLEVEGEDEELLRFREAIAHRLHRHIVTAEENWSAIGQASWSDFAVAQDKRL
ncbi:acylphosphatase [Aureliella helgolandensis]|uniref:acylphosphatase n=1 Tax=Aureliella helgolandensis TaxID=2527968 RepID=A0A518GE71_9BACT|nr:acylphosphatase [Aureliella helgolandensis]QDV26893.1 Acylphosphatase [Aureliella helgolandensis]